MTPIIEVKNLGKKYNIGERQGYVALRDVLTNIAKSPLKWFGGKVQSVVGKENPSDFWALKDINFTVEQGEVLGIIGRNGAGKSTLLKILSQITPPTTGEIRLKGRVGSLLEVGTGFHPELTGRENIYLNGAILGMRKKEIEKKFDEIVEFSGVEKFLDTPVKRYSSGMYVRLAFSVAAHLEPDILIIDEVLAVGDAEFQKKCLGKMEDVTKKDGRTVLFVSHNMGAVQRLCSKCILLDGGKITAQGPTSKVVSNYLNSFNSISASQWKNSCQLFSNPWFKPLEIFLSDKEGKLKQMPVRNDDDIWLNMIAEVKETDVALTVGYLIFSEDNIIIYNSLQTDMNEKEWPKINLGKCLLRSKIPANFLNEGLYRIVMDAGLIHRQYLIGPSIPNSPSLSLNIEGGLSESPYWITKRPGLTAPRIKWEATEIK
jgi:lipopolysaccharide transport system ATP-binding protein